VDISFIIQTIKILLNFLNIDNKNKYFLIGNVERKNNLVYFEIALGNKHIINEFNKKFNHL
jgi:hypothetical protein